jgi:hypothetical protein
MCVALEEMSQHRMGLYSPGCGTFGRYPPPAIWAGTKAQIQKYAVPTIREGWQTFFAITEPSGGSDPANAIQTRAELSADLVVGFVVHVAPAVGVAWGTDRRTASKPEGKGSEECIQDLGNNRTDYCRNAYCHEFGRDRVVQVLSYQASHTSSDRATGRRQTPSSNSVGRQSGQCHECRRCWDGATRLRLARRVGSVAPPGRWRIAQAAAS